MRFQNVKGYVSKNKWFHLYLLWLFFLILFWDYSKNNSEDTSGVITFAILLVGAFVWTIVGLIVLTIKRIMKKRSNKKNWGQDFSDALNRGIQKDIRDEASDPNMKMLRDLSLENKIKTSRKTKKQNADPKDDKTKGMIIGI